MTPMLMGAMPGMVRFPSCDCGDAFWLGVIVASSIAIVLALAAHHYFKE